MHPPMSDLTLEITAFDGYVPFLKARFQALKASKPQFSFAYCARKIGSTKSYLMHVLEGRKKIGASRISKIAALFELDEFETRYFTLQVLRELVSDQKTREYLALVLGKLRFERVSLGKVGDLATELASEFPLSHWLYGALIELMAFPDFRDDEKWVLSKLADGPKLSAGEVRSALDELIRQGIIEKRGKRFVVVKSTMSVPNAFNPESFKMYRGFVQKAWDVLGDVGSYGSCHFLEYITAVTPEGEKELLLAAEEFRDKVVAISEKTRDPSRIVMVSNNVFGLVRR
jgi:uncharacterized protein (TIGR02147 family)